MITNKYNIGDKVNFQLTPFGADKAGVLHGFCGYIYLIQKDQDGDIIYDINLNLKSKAINVAESDITGLALVEEDLN